MVFDIASLAKYPNSCGVYLMKDKQNKVLYVGKAKNIRARLKQYFSKTDERPTVPYLITQIESIDTIIVKTEKEALILENTLIKKHKPKYNILLKDDKTYISLLLTKHKWPMLKIFRQKKVFFKSSKGKLFGPYTSAKAARQTLELILKIFPLRQCSDAELFSRTRPCILYEIKKCKAPCTHLCTKQEYDHLVDGAKNLLLGKDKQFVKNLQKQMKKASKELQFEKAAKLLDLIKQIQHVLQIQHVDLLKNVKNSDVVGFYRKADSVVIALLEYREGKLTGSKNFHFSSIISSDEEMISSFLLQYYQEIFSPQILVPIPLPDKKMLEEIFLKKTKIISPIKGEKKELLKIASSNAKSLFVREHDLILHNEKMLLALQEKLQLTRFPKKILCFDTAHISQTNPVAAMVCFINGQRDKAQTKLFKIKDPKSLGDAQSLFHVLHRHLQKIQEQHEILPDLIIVDGAKAQLNSAIKVLQELNIASIDLIALTKEKGLHTKGLTQEKVYLPHQKVPVILPRTSPLLFLLQKIRDEAHRVAISFHKKRREKSLITSSLDAIPGIGKIKRKKLLLHFGSIKQMKKAKRKDFEKVKGLSKREIDAILAFFQEKS